MILALVWLTVSAPVVNAANQRINQDQSGVQTTDLADTEDSGCNPFGNNTEEKSPTSVGFNEEYLHHHEDALNAANLSLQHFRALAAREYVAFHGEMLCPPPNALS